MAGKLKGWTGYPMMDILTDAKVLPRWHGVKHKSPGGMPLLLLHLIKSTVIKSTATGKLALQAGWLASGQASAS